MAKEKKKPAPPMKLSKTSHIRRGRRHILYQKGKKGERSSMRSILVRALPTAEIRKGQITWGGKK